VVIFVKISSGKALFFFYYAASAQCVWCFSTQHSLTSAFGTTPLHVMLALWLANYSTMDLWLKICIRDWFYNVEKL